MMNHQMGGGVHGFDPTRSGSRAAVQDGVRGRKVALEVPNGKAVGATDHLSSVTPGVGRDGILTDGQGDRI
jgi:hypothetical protein